MMFWIGLLIGLFVGIVGTFGLSIFISGKIGDDLIGKKDDTYFG
jgi:hypothetical protein